MQGSLRDGGKEWAVLSMSDLFIVIVVYGQYSFNETKDSYQIFDLGFDITKLSTLSSHFRFMWNNLLQNINKTIFLN